MSRAAPLPGAELLAETDFSLKKPLVQAELFPENRFVLEEATCPGQLRCLGQNFSRNRHFLKKPLVLGSIAASGRTVFQKSDFFL